MELILLACIDYLGDPETGSRFLGMIIGAPGAINPAIKNFGLGPPRVSEITNAGGAPILFPNYGLMTTRPPASSAGRGRPPRPAGVVMDKMMALRQLGEPPPAARPPPACACTPVQAYRGQAPNHLQVWRAEPCTVKDASWPAAPTTGCVWPGDGAHVDCSMREAGIMIKPCLFKREFF